MWHAKDRIKQIFHSETRRGRSLTALLVAAVVAVAGPLRAETERGGAEPPSPAVDEARARYARATQLWDEGHHEGALVEFRRAYELTHEYRVLYNIAQVCYRLRDYV